MRHRLMSSHAHRQTRRIGGDGRLSLTVGASRGRAMDHRVVPHSEVGKANPLPSPLMKGGRSERSGDPAKTHPNPSAPSVASSLRRFLRSLLPDPLPITAHVLPMDACATTPASTRGISPMSARFSCETNPFFHTGAVANAVPPQETNPNEPNFRRCDRLRPRYLASTIVDDAS